MSVENCANCAFGVREYEHSAAYRYCHRKSPEVMSAVVGHSGNGPTFGPKTYWPRVSDTDFCGEFELKDAS